MSPLSQNPLPASIPCATMICWSKPSASLFAVVSKATARAQVDPLEDHGELRGVDGDFSVVSGWSG